MLPHPSLSGLILKSIFFFKQNTITKFKFRSNRKVKKKKALFLAHIRISLSISNFSSFHILFVRHNWVNTSILSG